MNIFLKKTDKINNGEYQYLLLEHRSKHHVSPNFITNLNTKVESKSFKKIKFQSLQIQANNVEMQSSVSLYGVDARSNPSSCLALCIESI